LTKALETNGRLPAIVCIRSDGLSPPPGRAEGGPRRARAFPLPADAGRIAAL